MINSIYFMGWAWAYGDFPEMTDQNHFEVLLNSVCDSEFTGDILFDICAHDSGLVGFESMTESDEQAENEHHFKYLSRAVGCLDAPL